MIVSSAEIAKLFDEIRDQRDAAIARAKAAEAKNEGLSSLLAALKEMSDKYDVMFYPSVRYWEVERWIKAAQQGAAFSVIDKDGGAKILVWDKERG